MKHLCVDKIALNRVHQIQEIACSERILLQEKMFHDILLKTKCDLEIHRIALKI